MNFSAFSFRPLLAAIFFIGSIGLLKADDANSFAATPALPPTLKRVAVLPLAPEDGQPDLTVGCETLDPVLQSELIKTKKFEVVPVSHKSLQELTGRLNWTGNEILPTNFVPSLQRVYGADAVLFCQLTVFHAYPPLAIGWRLKLVDLSTQKIIWAADVVSDASDAAVAKDAQDFQKEQQGGQKKSPTILRRVWWFLNREPAPATEDQWTILNSPQYFGQYSVVKMLGTLPQR